MSAHLRFVTATSTWEPHGNKSYRISPVWYVSCILTSSHCQHMSSCKRTTNPTLEGQMYSLSTRAGYHSIYIRIQPLKTSGLICESVLKISTLYFKPGLIHALSASYVLSCQIVPHVFHNHITISWLDALAIYPNDKSSHCLLDGDPVFLTFLPSDN